MQLQRLLLVSLMLSFFGSVWGQTLPYTFTQASGTYTPLTGGTSWQSGTTIGTNAVSSAITLPFSFNYNGVSCDRIYISNNGFITLANATTTTAPTATTYNPISASTGYIGSVAGYGYNLVHSAVSGAAPNISYGSSGSDFVVQFTDLARTGITGDRMSFQIRLTQTTNVIKIVYNNFAATTSTTTASNFGQVGLRGATNTSFSNRMVYATAPYNSWASSGAAGDNGATAATGTASAGGPNVMMYNSTYLPSSGLTYTWTPVSSSFYQTLPYSQNFESAWQNGSSVQDVPTSTGILTMPGTGNGSVRAHDVSLANSVWTGTSGSFGSLGTAQGSRAARFHSYNYSSGLKGYMDFYLDFSTSSGAKQLSFDYINPTGTDVLNILLSTDGGITFGSSLLSNGVATSWTSKSVSLGSTASSTCVVRFVFTSDFGNDDIGIDNINVSVAAPCTTPDAPTLATNTVTSTGLNLVITPPVANVPSGGYMVIRSTSATAPTLTDGTVFTTGGAYTVVSNDTSTNIVQTGLASNTQYYYYVYSQNTGCTGTPYYSTVATLSKITCPAPATLPVDSTITSSSASVSWTASAVGGSAETIKYRFELYTDAARTVSFGTPYPLTDTTSPVNIAGLSASTPYYYRIIAYNSSCQSTNLDGTFTTACSTQNIPYSENFNGVTVPAIPLCTTVINSGSGNLWATAANPAANGFTSQVLKYGFNSLNAANTWFFTKGLNLTSGTSYRLTFKYNNNSGFTEKLKVAYGVNITAAAMTTVLADYPAITGGAATANTATIDFVPTATGTFYIGFQAYSAADQFNLYLDDISVDLTPTDAVDYANIQSPGVSTTTSGTAVDIFGQAYEPGVTEAAGAGTGLVVWYSTNATDVDPSSAAWTGTWTLATFNTNVVNNDEWKGTITPILGQADTYYSFRYQLNGGPMRYGGYSSTGGGFWNGTTNKNGKLSINYEVYTTAVAPNNTVNNTIDVYLRDFDGINNFYTDAQTSIWMYAGVQVSSASQFQYIGTTAQNSANTATLVEFVRQSTNPNLYKATIKFADYFCIPAGTNVEGINLLFRNQYSNAGNDKTVDLFLNLTDATVAINAPTLAATTAITTTTATINWTAPTTGAIRGYDYYYSTSNTTPGASPSPLGSTAAGVTTANLTSLTPGTPYYFWVRTKGCNTDVSAWSTVGTFTTLNVPATYTWNGSSSTSWDTAGNWTKSGGGTGIPTSIDSVIITGTSVPNKLSIAANKTVTNFELTGSDATSFTITGNNALTITGNVAYTGTASAVLNCASTVNITNASNQPIPPLTYGNLNVLGGNRTFSPTGTIKICSAFSVNPTYTYTVTGSTVEYISSSTGWTMSPFTYHNLTFSGSGEFTLADGTINVGGNFVQSAGTFYLGDFGDPILNVTGNMTLGNNVFNSRNAYDSVINVGGDLNIITGGRLLSYSNYGTDTVNVTGNVQISGTGSWDNFSDLASNISIGGNLTLANNSEYYLYHDTVLTVGGNMILANNGYFSAEDGGLGENSIITVNGDFSQSGTTIFYLNDKITSVLNVNGNMSLVGPSIFDLNFATGGNATVNLKGNLSVDASSTLRAGNTNNATFNFNQTNGTVQNINVQSPVAAVDFVVGSQASAKLLNNLQITANTSLTVNGVFDADDKSLSGNGNNNQTLTVAATGTFKTANPLGFSGGTATAIVTSPATLDINVINLIAGSTIEYARAGDQVITNQTGVGQGTLGNYSNLKISGNGIKTAAVGDTNVQNMTTVSSGELLVPATAENVKPNSFTANKGLVVSTGAVFRLANNANLLQDATAVNSGEILAVRDLNFSASRQQYNYLISPLIGKNLKDIYKDGSGNPVAVPFTLYHNEATNKFYNSSGAYIVGRALAVKEAVGAGTATMSALFNGAPMNGSFNYTLVNSNTSDGLHGYNLIGNPYPSNLDLQQFYDNNKGSGNLSPTFYFWDNKANDQYTQAGSSYGGQSYAQYNVMTPTQIGTGVAATGDPLFLGTKTPTRYVKIGQGFMARTTASSLNITFDNTIRKAEIAEGFYGKNAQQAVPFDRFWLNMTSPANITSQIAVVYFAGGDNAYTKDDSRSVGGSDAIYSIIDGQQISINGKDSFVNTDVQPLGSKHFASGNYTIALGNKEGKFANGQNIYLKDKQTGIVTNLSEGNYTFTANAGESTGRFEIIYQPETVLATDTKVKESLIVYKDGNNFVVKAQNKKISSLEVFDSAGRLILALKPESIKAIIPAEKIINGLYVLKINQNGEITSKKIIR